MYFALLRPGKIILWCYLIWYLLTVLFLFDPSPALWLNSLGISLVIGLGLMLCISRSATEKPDRWQTFRLFAMPFCVSSFSSLIKGHGYILVFPPRLNELMLMIGACLIFVVLVRVLRLFKTR